MGFAIHPPRFPKVERLAAAGRSVLAVVVPALTRLADQARRFGDGPGRRALNRVETLLGALADAWTRVRREAARGRPDAPTRSPTPPLVPANPVLRTATPLIALMIRLHGLTAPANPEGLRHRIIAALRRFQSAARAAGVPPDQMRAAHFILCAALDDVIAHTGWGRRADWSERSLIRTFHKSIEAGPSLVTLLDHIQAEPHRHINELELVFVCMALGFEGRYRGRPDGGAEFQRLRDEMYRTIATERGAPGPDLSPSWRGLPEPPVPLEALLPPWVVASSAAALLTGLYMALAFSLGGDADRVYQRMAALLPDRPAVVAHLEPAAARAPITAPIAPSAPSARIKRLQAALAPEIAAGLIEVDTVRDRDLIRVWADRAFTRAGDSLAKPGHQVAERLADLLDREPGRILVVGHTDSQFTQSVRFPSSLALTEARARAVARVLVAHVAAPDRIDIEGRADTEPLATNAEPAGRERNRRIEIVLSSPEVPR